MQSRPFDHQHGAPARAGESDDRARQSGDRARESGDRARALLRAIGARVTHPRVQVLAALLDADQPMSHHDVQQTLVGRGQGESFDRVTLYRVLEWLTENRLSHRVSSDDRVFRFSAHGRGQTAHGHFKCTRCDRMYCMDEGPGLAQAVAPLVPGGFQPQRVDLTVLGVCAPCASTD